MWSVGTSTMRTGRVPSCFSARSRRKQSQCADSSTSPLFPWADPRSIILAEAMQNAGLRGKLSMDISTRPTYTEHTSAEAIVAASSFLDRMATLTADLPPHMRLVEPVLTPRFVPTCSDALLHGLGEHAARTGVRVQSHFAEARDEVDWVRSERGVDDIDAFDKARTPTLVPAPNPRSPAP